MQNTAEEILKSLKELKKESEKANSRLVNACAENVQTRAASVLSAYSGGAFADDKYSVKAFEAMRKRIAYMRKLDLISEENYYSELEKLRDTYFSAGSEHWLKYTAEIYEYNKKITAAEEKELEKRRKAAQNAYSDILSYADEQISAVEKKSNSFAEKLRGFVPILNRGTIRTDEETISFYSSLGDLGAQTEKMQKYAEKLRWLREKLSESGVGSEAANSFFNEILSKSAVDGEKTFYAFEHASNDELLNYFRAYEENLKVSGALSREFFAPEMESALSNTANYVKERLTEAGFEIPPEFFNCGESAAESFANGFSEKLDLELEKIRSRIEAFNLNLAENSAAKADSTTSYSNTQNIYNTSYSLNGGTADELYTKLRRYDTFRRLSGINGG